MRRDAMKRHKMSHYKKNYMQWEKRMGLNGSFVVTKVTRSGTPKFAVQAFDPSQKLFTICKPAPSSATQP
jgi:hypothetical protein